MPEVSYGTYPVQGLTAGAELQDEIALAEASGFAAIYFSEHHGVPGFPPTPLALTSFALGATTTLRAGPMPLLLPLHEPVRIAEEAALIHHVSGGRLVLGVAPGFLPVDFDQLGIPLAERGKRMDEGLEILRQLWAGEHQEFHGEFYNVFGEETLTFLPYAGTPPKLWICSQTKTGMLRAARLGAGLSLDSVQPFEVVARTIQTYRDLCASLGRPSGPISVMRRAWFGTDREVDEFLGGYLVELNRYLSVVGESKAPWVDGLRGASVGADAARERVFVGAPDAVAEQMASWMQALDVDEVILKFQWGERDAEKNRTQLIRAGEVIDALHQLPAEPKVAERMGI